MTSSQTAPDLAEEIDTDEPDDTEGRFEYELPGADHTIYLAKPDDAQVAVLVRLESMLEDAPVSGVQLYMDALGALMRDQDEQWCLRALLRGRLKLEVFADVARQTLFHFYPDLKKAADEREKTSKVHGPATRRPRRR
jgi:hypothetical protein